MKEKQTNVTAVAACHLKTSESEFEEILRHFLTRQQASYNIISIFFLLSVCGYADDVKGKTILIYCIFSFVIK